MILLSHDVSRRGLLRSVGVVGLTACLPVVAFAASAAPTQPGEGRFRSFSVDTQPLADRGLPNYAIRIAKMAEPILASVFADRVAPARSDAPRLVLRIDSITLDSSGFKGPGSGAFGFENRDWISGAGEIVDAHGKVLAVKPIETSTEAFGSAGDILTVENIRTERLITILAEWVKQAV